MGEIRKRADQWRVAARRPIRFVEKQRARLAREPHLSMRIQFDDVTTNGVMPENNEISCNQRFKLYIYMRLQPFLFSFDCLAAAMARRYLRRVLLFLPAF